MLIDRFRLGGRRVVITGGGTGIGLTAALAFVGASSDVVIAGPDYDVVTSSCQKVADRTNLDRGPGDILVADAGVTWLDTAAEDLKNDAWRKLFDVNVHGTFWTCRAFGRRMLERQAGSIVTSGSILGVISNKPQWQAHYNTSVAANQPPDEVPCGLLGAARRARELRGPDLREYADVQRQRRQ